MTSPIDSAKKLDEICRALRQLIDMSYEHQEGACPSNLLDLVFGEADKLASEISQHFEQTATIQKLSISSKIA